MVSLVLSVVVMSASGGLLSERTPAVGMLVGAVNLRAEASSYDTMSVEELTTERVRLVEEMPSPGLGIGLTAAGGAVLITGLIIISASYYVEVVVAVGLIVMAASIPLLIIGPILLFGALRERREFQTKVRLVDRRIAQIGRDPMEVPVRNDSPPENNEVPPPPPMRPPGSELTPVEPPLQLATF